MQPAKTTGTKSSRGLAVLSLIGILAGALAASQAMAQTPAPAAARPMELTATSAGVNGAGEKIDFFINKWSTDTERDQLSAAWSLAGIDTGAAARGTGTRGAEARGGAERGGAPAPEAPVALGAADPAAAGAQGAANAGGGGRGGRGGGGGGRGGGAAAAPKTPESALAGAMKELPNLGYFWTSEVGGYLIRYAYRLPLPDGGTRIILLTDKRLGASKNKWQLPAALTPNKYEFSLIELRLPAKGEGEAKVSLTGSLTVDPGTRSLALDGYDALPVLMKGVKVR